MSVQTKSSLAQDILIFSVAAIVGLVIWRGVSALTAKPEAWDSNLFWSTGLPAMVLASAIGGYVRPVRSWLWGLGVVSLQPVDLLVNTGGGPFILVGLMFFGVFAAVCALSAYGGGALRGKLGGP